MRQSIPYDKEMSDEEKQKLAGLEAIYGGNVDTVPVSSEIMNTVDQDYINKLTDLPINEFDVQSQMAPNASTSVLPKAQSSAMPSMSSTNPVSTMDTGDRASKVEALKQTLAQKYGLDKYSNEERNKLVQDIQKEREGEGFDFANLAVGIGAGLQGRNVSEAMDTTTKAKEARRTQKLTDFDKARTQAIENIKLGQEMKDYEDKDSLRQREMDVNSQESQLARTLASKMLPSKDFSSMNAAQINKALPSLAKIYDIEQKKLDRAELRTKQNLEKEAKLDEKMQALKTPVGTANTVEDAKNLKEGFEAKKNFDAKIQEMIDLRKRYGGEVFNREAVARGKQLSKDLLLEYKNMAKLGVLSKSDEDIINAIIPSDPLAFSPSSVVGQDPILSNLEKFKDDSDRDFATKVSTRTREGLKNPQPSQQSQEVERKTKDGKIAVFDAQTKKFLRYK